MIDHRDALPFLMIDYSIAIGFDERLMSLRLNRDFLLNDPLKRLGFNKGTDHYLVKLLGPDLLKSA